MRSGGQIVVDALVAHGVDRVFCVPGESYLAVLDALVDTGIDVVVARHEGAAANMAEADGKLTGRPGVCLVTRGPGATHACVGVHTARQDSTPMVLLIGQVDTVFRGREAFQEVDYTVMFAGLAKWVAEVESPGRLPEYLGRAFAVAVSGRPGPVVLALPEDVLFGQADVADVAPMSPIVHAPADVGAIGDMLRAATRPLLLVGGGGWTPGARADLATFAAAWDLPVASGFRRQSILDNADPRYVGHVGLSIDPELAARVRAADLIVAIGPRLGETTTGAYELIAAPVPAQTLIHCHADPSELGRVYRPALAVCAAMPPLLAALRALPASDTPWGGWRSEARDRFEAFTRRPLQQGKGVDLEAVVAGLSDRLGPETLVCNGAGNYAIWVQRFWRFGPGTQLAPTSGAMGYGLPAAIAAKRRYPQRTVLCVAGDGCWQMYPQELATAVQHDAAVIALICDNGMFGTIRMHQERRYPGRVSATAIRNPDFTAIARAHGAFGARVETTGAFWPAFEAAHAFTRTEGRPAVLHLLTDPARNTPAS